MANILCDFFFGKKKVLFGLLDSHCGDSKVMETLQTLFAIVSKKRFRTSDHSGVNLLGRGGLAGWRADWLTPGACLASLIKWDGNEVRSVA
jgi:hypothetical protein